MLTANAHPVGPGSRRLLAALLLPLLLGGCRSAAKPAVAADQEGRRLTAAFLDANRARYRQAIDRTLSYLNAFSIDPVDLRRRGIKGQKKLVELLDAYVSLHRYAKEPRRVELATRFRAAAQVTARSDYHTMGTVDDRQFKQDATSYLRACYLMDRMGLDTSAYRREIAKIKPRLDAHLAQRGAHQLMAFKFYYEHFKLAKPPILDQPLSASVVARRLPLESISRNGAYDLTHEVFVPYDYGGGLDRAPFTAEERTYLKTALEGLARRFLQPEDVDILGEVLASLRYLGHDEHEVYRKGLAIVLDSQRPNGSFGNYERLRARRGALLELDLYLHTTSVVMDVLPLAFEGAAPR